MILSFLSAVGIGVLVFQVLLGRQLHWSVPGFAFVVLVAVGADYNMLLASRLRDESGRGFRYGVIRTVRSTGVITAAGLIFTASMAGCCSPASVRWFRPVSSSGGHPVGIFRGVPLPFPAIATLFGRLSWWPAEAVAHQWCGEGAGPVERPSVFDKVLAAA